MNGDDAYQRDEEEWALERFRAQWQWSVVEGHDTPWACRRCGEDDIAYRDVWDGEDGEHCAYGLHKARDE